MATDNELLIEVEKTKQAHEVTRRERTATRAIALVVITVFLGVGYFVHSCSVAKSFDDRDIAVEKLERCKVKLDSMDRLLRSR